MFDFSTQQNMKNRDPVLSQPWIFHILALYFASPQRQQVIRCEVASKGNVLALDDAEAPFTIVTLAYNHKEIEFLSLSTVLEMMWATSTPPLLSKNCAGYPTASRERLKIQTISRPAKGLQFQFLAWPCSILCLAEARIRGFQIYLRYQLVQSHIL